MIMHELSSVFSLVNYAFVLFFGIVAALYLADIGFCDHKRVYVLTLFFFVFENEDIKVVDTVTCGKPVFFI